MTRTIRPILFALVLALFATACASTPEAPDTPEARTEKLIGTQWTLTYTDAAPDDTPPHRLTFEANARLKTTHPRDTTPDNDEWSVTDTGVAFWYNNRYVEYRCSWDGPDRLNGEAVNIEGRRWNFILTR